MAEVRGGSAVLSGEGASVNGRRLLDARGVAGRLGCSVRQVFRLADGGQIPWGVKLGGLRRWDSQQIDDFIAVGCKPTWSEGG